MSLRALEENALHHEQRARRITEEGEDPSDQKIGFVGAADDGTITATSALGLDRLEATTGSIRESPT